MHGAASLKGPAASGGGGTTGDTQHNLQKVSQEGHHNRTEMRAEWGPRAANAVTHFPTGASGNTSSSSVPTAKVPRLSLPKGHAPPPGAGHATDT